MSFWQILGNRAAFDEGKLIQRVSENTSISSDGSTRMVGGATGIGAVLNDQPHFGNRRPSDPRTESDSFL